MKSLLEYIVENINNITNAFESKMGDAAEHNWNHNGKFDYAIKVLDNIINDKLVILGDKHAEQYIKFELTNKDKEMLNDFKSNITSKTYKDFDSIILGLKYTIYDDDEVTIKSSNQKINSLWGKIFKTPYSGKGGDAGQSYSEAAEFLVTYLFNLGEANINNLMKVNNDLYKAKKEASDEELNRIKEIFKEINNSDQIINNVLKWSKNTNRRLLDETDSPYLYSSIKSAKLAYELLKQQGVSNEKYYAIQVNGNQLEGDRALSYENNKSLINAIKCFGDKTVINKLCGGQVNVKELFGGSNKDGWNKADIILIKDGINLYELLQKEMNEFISTMQIDNNKENIILTKFNSLINKYINDKLIFPISLKLIPYSSNGSLENESNIDVNTKSESKIESLDENDKIELVLPQSIEPNTPMASTYIKAYHTLKNKSQNVIYILQFRTQSGKSGVNNLTIQASIDYTDDKGRKQSMRMGKGISAVKNKLNLKGNTYYKEIESNEDLAKLINQTFSFYDIDDTDKIVNTNTDINKININKLINKLESIKNPGTGKNKVELYQRTAFKGMFGILSSFFGDEKLSNLSKDDIRKGFDYLYQTSTLNENEYKSIWWLIM